MPTLNWIGKEAVVNHHHKVPFHLLKDVPDLSVGDPGSGNLIVQGDNLVVLKALLPYYAGQVKCIFIDVPYNTGNEGWVYNDNVNSPTIRAWLGKVVGDEASDLSRHDKWLCMMYPRLRLLRQLLCDDGVLFVQIGDEEGARLKLLLDEVSFFFKNAIIVRRGVKNVQAQFKTVDSLATGHDTILLYAKTANLRLPRLQHNLGEAENGKWDTFWRGTDRPTMRYEIFGVTPPTGQWRWQESRAKQAKRNYEEFLSEVAGRMTLDEYYSFALTTQGADLDFVRKDDSGTVQYYVPPRSYKIISDMWMDVSTAGQTTDFPHEKHTDLLKRIVRWTTGPDDLVLDSFGGSGSTGAAVLELNQEDNSNRRFVLVELEHKVARDVLVKRMRQAVQDRGGHSGFRYCELGEPLFDERGQIKTAVKFADLARHVYFTETGEPLPRERVPNTPKLGVCRGVGVYLLFNGILGDKSAGGGNVLTRAVLEKLPKHDGPKVVYAAGCRLGKETLRAEQITFRQTPYEIKVT
jgi:site-specific DNA-methyltransferase (adenine-specific)/adenine-specific DNA-methyltransferase